MRCWIGAFVILVWAATPTIRAQESIGSEAVQGIDGEDEEMDDERLLPNVPMPTMGGKQFWTDHRWYFGWRLQHNLVTDHWRVLSPKGIRRAWGGHRACLEQWQAHVDQNPMPTPNRVVILIHGLMRTTGSMDKLAGSIAAQLNQPTASFSYASTRGSIESHAAALREWTENLPGQPELYFVGHSLGNIVVRHAMGDWERRDPHGVLPRIRGMVMLGPPNNGSSLATQLSRLGLFEIVAGRSGMELGPEWQKVQERLAIPRCPCHIIAGDLADRSLRNPLLNEDGDLVVTVDETKLPAIPSSTLPILHSFLPSDDRSIELTINRLREFGAAK